MHLYQHFLKLLFRQKIFFDLHLSFFNQLEGLITLINTTPLRESEYYSSIKIKEQGISKNLFLVPWGHRNGHIFKSMYIIYSKLTLEKLRSEPPLLRDIIIANQGLSTDEIATEMIRLYEMDKSIFQSLKTLLDLIIKNTVKELRRSQQYPAGRYVLLHKSHAKHNKGEGEKRKASNDIFPTPSPPVQLEGMFLDHFNGKTKLDPTVTTADLQSELKRWLDGGVIFEQFDTPTITSGSKKDTLDLTKLSRKDNNKFCVVVGCFEEDPRKSSKRSKITPIYNAYLGQLQFDKGLNFKIVFGGGEFYDNQSDYSHLFVYSVYTYLNEESCRNKVFI